MTATAAAPAPDVAREADRRHRLVVMKRRASALLAAVTVVFVLVTVFGGDATWAGYVQAMAEAASRFSNSS